MSSPNSSHPFLARFAWGLLFYGMAVIVFGAFVRATNSGDGCGAHWPLCNGEFIPLNPSSARIIEFTHRVSSGLFGISVFVMLIAVLRSFAPGSAVRKAAVAAMIFTIIEALIGAMLVKQGWVAQNNSVGRAVGMAAHLTNTFLLLSSLVATAHWTSGKPTIKLFGQGRIAGILGLSLVGVLVLGVSGAITALGDTLFPAQSIAEGVRQDLDPRSSALLAVRFLHPLISVGVVLFLLWTARAVRRERSWPEVKRFSGWVSALALTQIGIGVLNFLLLAPVWMQLVHLFLADAMWVALVLLALAAMRQAVVSEGTGLGLGATERAAPSRAGELIKAYLTLTKPRVVSLLLFTTLTAMVMAAGGWPGTWLFLAVALGGYMAAGAANALNMAIERDLDERMERTAHRPTVTRLLPTSRVFAFALILETGSFALLWGAANLLTAILALAGLLFYVLVYTMALKRRTWQNIVIGGAAGAIPPLVGWAAVTGQLSALAWILFALIFVWTPVHFWALAILIKDDYAKAGIPMLPVVHGERLTTIQMGAYAILTAVVSLLPMLQPNVGSLYFATAILFNIVLIAQCVRLYKTPGRAEAKSVFKFSMVYLAVLFLSLAVDRVVSS